MNSMGHYGGIGKRRYYVHEKIQRYLVNTGAYSSDRPIALCLRAEGGGSGRGGVTYQDVQALLGVLKTFSVISNNPSVQLRI